MYCLFDRRNICVPNNCLLGYGVGWCGRQVSDGGIVFARTVGLPLCTVLTQEDRNFDIHHENFKSVYAVNSVACYAHVRKFVCVCDLVADGQVCTFAHLDGKNSISI